MDLRNSMMKSGVGIDAPCLLSVVLVGGLEGRGIGRLSVGKDWAWRQDAEIGVWNMSKRTECAERTETHPNVSKRAERTVTYWNVSKRA